jgi:hypothetical protein
MAVFLVNEYMTAAAQSESKLAARGVVTLFFQDEAFCL